MENLRDSWVYNIISESQYEAAFEMANESLVSYALDHVYDIDFTLIDKVIEVLELTLLEAVSQENLNDNLVIEISQKNYTLLRIKPLPQKPIEKMKQVIHLIVYSYIGERWESGRRFLFEEKKECYIAVDHDLTWNVRLFTKIYKAIIYLVRKDGWNDLEQTSKMIARLREEQKIYEDNYLNLLASDEKIIASYELISLYHLAKIVDLMAGFILNGEMVDIREQIDLHFESAIDAAENGGIISMNLMLKMLKLMFHKMISNSIWTVTQKVNSRVTRFVKNIVKQENPVFELMYPQKHAILEGGLLDPAHKAIVVNMPTSSGKTLIAQFRILQALNQFSDDKGWVVYVAPTKALVNQVTIKLQKDFRPIGIYVEKMSGAIEIDSFEEKLLTSDKSKFDVLVTTPEKMNLLIRGDVEGKLNRPLALVVVDEAHNLESKSRGLSLEFLLSNIKNDCPKANFLLLTPFIKNSDQVARWLDADNPRSISVGINWKPNDRVLGAIYPEGNGRHWNTYYQTLLTSSAELEIERKFLLGTDTPLDITRSKLTKSKLSFCTAKQLLDRNGILLIAKTPTDCWKIANGLWNEIGTRDIDVDVELVKRFIAAEYGEDFDLIRLLDKRIGVHHSGLSEEIKLLIEWLMDNQKLNVLVATTTIAQGINFPVSTIIMASYSYPYTSCMPARDFWNLVGRAGRMNQGEIGIIGVVLGEKNEKQKEEEIKKLATYIRRNTEELVSQLTEIVEDTIRTSEHFDLASQFYKPEWSEFLQYITHMFNQCKGLSEFEQKTDLFLRRTFGYKNIRPAKQKILLKAVHDYGHKLNQNKGMAKLSDSTGFSMETLKSTIFNLKKLGMDNNSWQSTSLFQRGSSLKDLIGVMLKIPEIKKNMIDIKNNKGMMHGDTIANLTSDWVNGVELEEIAESYFGNTDENSMTDCCKTIYSKLINSSTWGLSSIQKISGLDEQISEEEKKKINNLPAMIYYGVNTDEAILMRINSVPRSIATTLGADYKNSFADIHSQSIGEAKEWIKQLPQDRWDTAVTKKNLISGADYKRIWNILSGGN